MKLSELIAAAQERMEKLGDVKCQVYSAWYDDGEWEDVADLEESAKKDGTVFIKIL